MRKDKRGRIRPDAEEGRLPEGENAGIAPKDVDRQCRQRAFVFVNSEIACILVAIRERRKRLARL